MPTRFPEKKEELELLMNTLSTRVANAVVVRVGLKMCGRRMEEYIKSGKSEMLLFWSHLSRSPLKSPSKATVLFSEERLHKRFVS